jgi:hypothetical protein
MHPVANITENILAKNLKNKSLDYSNVLKIKINGADI